MKQRIFISSVQKEFAEPEFKLTDGFVITIRRKPGRLESSPSTANCWNAPSVDYWRM